MSSNKKPEIHSVESGPINDEIVSNEFGGRQSRIATRYTLLPWHGVNSIAELMTEKSAIYGDDNWHLIPIREHLDHAISHLAAYFMGSEDCEDDLQHAACRLLMALDQRESWREFELQSKKEVNANE